jgi:hypothetical protein
MKTTTFLRVITTAALVALVLGGCSGSAPPRLAAATPPQTSSKLYEAAVDVFVQCAIRRVVEFDDGRSEAATIARAVGAACRSEARAAEELNPLAPTVSALARMRIADQSAEETALRMVLDNRRALRGGHRWPV